jgi:hypothetical protein
VVLVLKENNTYEYVANGKVFNSGNWDFENNGWLQISFHKWKDLPSFELHGCKTTCLVIVTYDDGELIFQPDDASFNFKR